MRAPGQPNSTGLDSPPLTLKSGDFGYPLGLILASISPRENQNSFVSEAILQCSYS